MEVWFGVEQVMRQPGRAKLTIERECQTKDVHHDLPRVQLGVLGIELVQWLAYYKHCEFACLHVSACYIHTGLEVSEEKQHPHEDPEYVLISGDGIVSLMTRVRGRVEALA